MLLEEVVELGDDGTVDVDGPFRGSTLDSDGVNSVAGQLNFKWSLEDLEDVVGNLNIDLRSKFKFRNKYQNRLEMQIKY